MEFRVCTNCGKIHLLDEKIDEKREIVDGKLEPIKCTCVFPRVIRVWEYVEDACKQYAFHHFFRSFIIRNGLYEFAFRCAGEPYKAQYSEKIKKAIVNDTVYSVMEIENLLKNDIVLFKKFYSGFEYYQRINADKNMF